MAVYGYTRVSTGKQAEEGESLEAQQEQIRGYAKGKRLSGEVVMFVEKGVSGSVPLCERQEGKRLLSQLERGDVIITPKLDRMFRSALDALGVLERLQKVGVSLHMIDLGGDVTGNGISKIVFTMMSAFAEWERDRIRERIQDVKTDQRRRNRFLGGSVPFGWTVGAEGELLEEPEQQGAIRRMATLRMEGASLRVIAAVMQEAGFSVSHAGVKTILAGVGTRGIAA